MERAARSVLSIAAALLSITAIYASQVASAPAPHACDIKYKKPQCQCKLDQECGFLHCEIEYKKPQIQCTLYQECGFLCLISGSTRSGHPKS
eukprot:2083418-Rhodomonas_salina.3